MISAQGEKMIKVSNRPLSASGGDTIVYLVRQEKKAPSCSDRQVSAYIKQAYALGDFKGKSSQRLILYRPVKKGGKTAAKPMRVMIVGLGKDDPDLELFRKIGGTIAGTAMKLKTGRLRIEMVEGLDIGAEDIARGLSEGLIMCSYCFDKYKKEDPEDKKYRLKEVVLHTTAATSVKKGVKRGTAAALAVNIARDMANEPGNFWTPTHFAETGKALAKEKGLTCTVLEKAAMKKLGMGGIVGVNQGSDQPPKMVILEYRGSKSKKAPTLLLVGKGLTFDSGGISLKPGAGMQDMKYDMCGGAAVMAAMRAVAELKPSGINVVAVIPSTDNMPGPGALKPGDIITHYNGKTVEVINTDAEGRLILADALAYGIDKFRPDAVIDIATLTGAVIIGLGHHQTGMLSNDDELAGKLLDSGKQSGEPNWRLPLGDDYQKQLKSEVADLKNIGGRAAGTVTAACFLQEFVGETPWAHLDIAGTAWNYTKKSYMPKGPSGVGVRTLIDLVLNWK
jgi:leucyl aminopeptidase